MKSFLIGELTRRAGVNKETVRYYESKGLLDPPKRRSSEFHDRGYREYTDATVLQINMIKQLKRLGFTLGEIRLLFDLFDGGATHCDDFIGTIETKVEEIESELARLKAIRTTLDTMLTKCEKGGLLEACVVLDKLKRSELLD